jgi:hypothetical protein
MENPVSERLFEVIRNSIHDEGNEQPVQDIRNDEEAKEEDEERN